MAFTEAGSSDLPIALYGIAFPVILIFNDLVSWIYHYSVLVALENAPPKTFGKFYWHGFLPVNISCLAIFLPFLLKSVLTSQRSADAWANRAIAIVFFAGAMYISYRRRHLIQAAAERSKAG